MRMKYDEIDKLILFKRMNISVEVPEHLQAEFDLRWTQFERERAVLERNNKLLQNPLSVERYKIATPQRGPAEYVLYENYELVVTYLQEQLSRAWSEASSGRYDSSTSWRD
jgi:hypothetical protein